MIASAYSNSHYSIDTRCPGYNGQTKFITNELLEKTSGEVSNNLGYNLLMEPYGGGDNYYLKDTNLIYSIYNTYFTSTADKTASNSPYFISGRRYYYQYRSSGNSIWCIDYVNSNYGVDTWEIYNTTGSESTRRFHFRTIVTLKSGLKATGNGTLDEPWIFE